MRDVAVTCTQCGLTVVLPPLDVEVRGEGWVSIEPVTGWTFPPPKCPMCSAADEAAAAPEGPTS